MPRKRRPVHTDRVYHVFNRGNYRQPIFRDQRAMEAFLRALHETLKIYRWEVYAYAIMPNHYHLCLRTPDGDLSDGMHRLLTAFNTRFNRFRKESGHPFQGRFKSVVSPLGMSVRRFIDYIHLNPVRAQLLKLPSLAKSRVTSLSAYLNPGMRGSLAVSQAFQKFVGFEDTPAGHAVYMQALMVLAQEDAYGEKFEQEWRVLGKMEKLMPRNAPVAIVPELATSRQTVQTKRRDRWEAELIVRATALDMDLSELMILPRRDPRKLELARQLYRDIGAPASWIAPRLNLGRPSNLHTLLA